MVAPSLGFRRGEWRDVRVDLAGMAGLGMWGASAQCDVVSVLKQDVKAGKALHAPKLVGNEWDF